MNRTLFSLAIIRSNWEVDRKDYIENFVPLFATLIKSKAYDKISIEKLDEIKQDFKNEYGLHIPSNPVITILNRLSKKGLIKKDHGHFTPVTEKLDKINITKKSQQIEREYDHVIVKLDEFIKNRHNLIVSHEDIDKALIDYLKKHDLDLLFAAEKNSLLPNIKSSKKLNYLINEFFGEAFRSDPNLFKFIVNLSIGHALSATILYNDFDKFAGKFRGLNLFLDTPFILNLLGIDGVHKKSLAEELVTILNKEGVNLYVLEITQTEITTNLETALSLLEKGNIDPTKGSFTFRSCISNGFNENDIEQLLLKLDEIYEGHSICKDRVPNYDEFRDYQINEEKLYNKIVEVYETKKKKNPEKKEETKSKQKENKEDKINNTIFRDVQVLSGVYRFRLGNNPKTLKDCKYLFITTSSSLAYASRAFEISENGNRYSLPTCLTDVFLGTLIWLHSPNQIEAISEKKIIADCYAAMKPSEKLITKYLDDIEKLKSSNTISNDDYVLLRTHRTAINLLENKTFGDINEFTSETSKEILDSLIQRIKEGEIEKLNEEKDHHEQTKTQLENSQIQIDSYKSILEQKEQDDIQKQLNTNKKIKADSIVEANRWTLLIQIILVLLFIIPISLVAYDKFTDFSINPSALKYCWIITTIFGIVNIVTGFNIMELRQTFKKYLTSKIIVRKNTQLNKYK